MACKVEETCQSWENIHRAKIMPKSNNTIAWRVEQLEKGYEKLDEKMDKLMSNHIPHLEQTVSNVRTEVRVLAIINVGALILFKILS